MEEKKYIQYIYNNKQELKIANDVMAKLMTNESAVRELAYVRVFW